MRTLLVEGEKQFRIVVPDDAKITFGPWSPPKKDEFRHDGDKRGTLRIYQGTKDNIIACFAGVTSFRDLSMEYSEKVAVEEGDSIWKSDNNGYERRSNARRTEQWTDPVRQLNPAPKRVTRKRR